jgi:peptidoglycan/xylan/chitin deacetylase (PgdA/CDA1 family)
MPALSRFGGKRELLARGLYRSGCALFCDWMPARDSLLVLNYHRIGNPEDDLFDPGVFSATASELDEQLSYLKRHVSLVTLEEALAFAEGAIRDKARRCRVLMTFDDGYLDNYQTAFPILRSHGVQGVFFLSTGLVGSSEAPWWDRVAYLLRTARTRRFTLRYPAEMVVDPAREDLAKTLSGILRLYKDPANTDPSRFLRELAEAVHGGEPPSSGRRFLDWEEAREMAAGGMAIGSHTHSHTVLSQLEPERQRQELAQSRALLGERLGREPEAIAYPVGLKTSFSDETQRIARETGYRAAFSYYGETNLPGATRRFDIRRVGVGGQSWPRFRVQAAICRLTGNYWP